MSRVGILVAAVAVLHESMPRLRKIPLVAVQMLHIRMICDPPKDNNLFRVHHYLSFFITEV
jgi:hypothetical protein